MRDAGLGAPEQVSITAYGDQRPTRHYVFVLIVVLLMAETTTYGAILFYTALPYMSPPFTPVQLPWIISITLLVAAAVQPLMGKLADVFGRKRLLMAVAVLFILGSLVGALTSSFALMMVARTLQASAVALPGVIYSFFREYLPKRMVPVAVGMNSTNIGVSAIIAPFIAGGLLAGFGDYHAIFWFCVIYMAVFASIVYLVIPENRSRAEPRQRRKVDALGSALVTFGAGLVLFGISDGATLGWTALGTLLPLVAGIALLAGFVLAEYRVREPMIDMRLLGGHALRTTLAVSLLGGVLIGSWGYIVPQILETQPVEGIDYGFGLTAVAVGLITLSHGAASIICGPLGGQIAKRTSPRLVMLLCCGVGTVAAVLMAFMHNELWHFIVFGILGGITSGFYFAAGPNLIIEAVPDRLTGVSTGMQAFTSAFAGSAMPVVIGAILAANVLRTDPATHQVVYASSGYAYVFLVMAAACLVAFAMTLKMRHGRAPATGGATIH